ncbi:hypothetical protein Salat_0672400 [Sesamum alatum]|uniref:Uncharacterized protein n=1 Tax=Sesamum alatum TaxID=300844 RepID=A0AAE1YSA0_9LAMI|nr:hypothetical protein Salat_0672400 [Sesamum alatum]
MVIRSCHSGKESFAGLTEDMGRQEAQGSNAKEALTGARRNAPKLAIRKDERPQLSYGGSRRRGAQTAIQWAAAHRAGLRNQVLQEPAERNSVPQGSVSSSQAPDEEGPSNKDIQKDARA